MNDLPKGWYTSKTIWGSILTTLWPIATALAPLFHYTLPSQDSMITLLADAGTVVAAGVAIYGRVFASAPIAKPSTPAVAKVASYLVIGLMLNLVLGCATLSADAAIVQQKTAANATAIGNFCTNTLNVDLSTPLAVAASAVSSDIAAAIAGAKISCAGVSAVAGSISTLPWLQSVDTIIKSGGKVIPPAIEPAPVTSSSVVPGAS